MYSVDDIRTIWYCTVAHESNRYDVNSLCDHCVVSKNVPMCLSNPNDETIEKSLFDTDSVCVRLLCLYMLMAHDAIRIGTL